MLYFKTFVHSHEEAVKMCIESRLQGGNGMSRLVRKSILIIAVLSVLLMTVTPWLTENTEAASRMHLKKNNCYDDDWRNLAEKALFINGKDN